MTALVARDDGGRAGRLGGGAVGGGGGFGGVGGVAGGHGFDGLHDLVELGERALGERGLGEVGLGAEAGAGHDADALEGGDDLGVALVDRVGLAEDFLGLGGLLELLAVEAVLLGVG